MNEHTKEPWYVGHDYYGGVSIRTSPDHATNIVGDDAIFENTGRSSGDMEEADARRIVVCVNACAGIPIETLESKTVLELIYDGIKSEAMQSLGEEP